MKITLCALSNMSTTEYDLPDDITIENVLCLAVPDLGLEEGLKYRIFRGKVCLAKGNEDQKTLKDIGAVENDLLTVVVPESAVIPNQPAQATPSTSNPNNFVLPASLAKAIASIKVPQVKRLSKEENMRNSAMDFFKMLEDPNKRGRAFYQYRELFDQWQKAPNDFEAFFEVYKSAFEKMVREQALRNDPNSEEGQKLIQQDIMKERIAYSYQQTMEHHPEYMVRTNMLYINMTINKCDVKAFVDSGAQVSIMSEDCARRCDLIDLIDLNFRSVARGVGGNEEIIGRIHGCDVRIENHHFACTFEVMKNRDMDLLLGLNVLRIHQCCINLKLNRLEMGDGTTTQFLNEYEVNKIQEAKNKILEESVVVDDAKLSQVMELGFSQEEAVIALKKYNNDANFAISYLYESQARGSSEPGPSGEAMEH